MPDIVSICPLDGYRMEVRFSTGKTVTLDLTDKLRTIRFKPLSDKRLFESAVTDGESIFWNELIEISSTEILTLAQAAKPGP
jgi:hypothetical protein